MPLGSYNKKGAWLVRKVKSKEVVGKFRTKPSAIRGKNSMSKLYLEELELVCDKSKQCSVADKISSKIVKQKEYEEYNDAGFRIDTT